MLQCRLVPLRGVGRRLLADNLGLYSAGPGVSVLASSRCAGAEPNDQRGLVGLMGERR